MMTAPVDQEANVTSPTAPNSVPTAQPNVPVEQERRVCAKPQTGPTLVPVAVAPAKTVKKPHNNKERLKVLGISKGVMIDNGRWSLGEVIAEGGFGQIFHCTYNGSAHCGKAIVAAVKVEPKDATLPLLHVEASCMSSMESALPNSPFFLHMIGSGSTDKINYLIMHRAGRNLRDVKKATSFDRMSRRATLTLGRLMVKSIEQMHECGWLHRDVKPSNFCLHMPTNGYIVAIDFGLARKFVDANGVIKPARAQSGFHGTTRYASPRTHRHEDMGRCDDLWPVFFVMLEMAVGQLPWRSVSDKGQDTVSYSTMTQLPSLLNLHKTLKEATYATDMDYFGLMSSFMADMPLADRLDAITVGRIDHQVEKHYKVCLLADTPLPSRSVCSSSLVTSLVGTSTAGGSGNTRQ